MMNVAAVFTMWTFIWREGLLPNVYIVYIGDFDRSSYHGDSSRNIETDVIFLKTDPLLIYFSQNLWSAAVILFGFWNLPDYLNNCGCEGQSRQNVEGWDEHVEPLVCMQVYHFLWVSMYYNGTREVIKWQFEDKKNYLISTKSLIKREQPTHFRHHQICLVSCPQVQWLLRWWNKNRTHRRMTWSFFLNCFTISSVFFTYHSS